MKTIESKVAQLESELAKQQQKVDRLDKQAREARSKLRDIEYAIRREKLRECIGGEVRPKYPDEVREELRGKTGTLIEVRRTQCTVCFGDLGDFDFSIPQIALPGEEQCETIFF